MTAPAGSVTVRYWAGVRARAGRESDTFEGCATVADALAAAHAAHPGLDEVTSICSFLVNGRVSRPDAELPADAVLEVLPPFAGG